MNWIWWVCAAQTLQCTSDRSWDFFVPIALASSFPGTLFPVAAVETAQTIGRLCFAPKVALWFAEQASAQAAYCKLLLVQLVATASCGVLLILVTKQLLQGQGNAVLSLFLVVAGVLSAVEAGIKVVLVSVVSKVWPSGFSAGERELANANSKVTVCDLLAAAVTPFAISGILAPLSYAATAVSLILWQLAASAGMMGVSLALGKKLASLESKASPDGKLTGPASPQSGLCQQRAPLSLRCVLMEWLGLPRHVRGAMLAMVLLYCTVLCERITPWLRMQGVSVASIAAWRSSMQLIAFLGAAASPLVVRRFGLLRTAQIGQLWQMCSILPAVAAFLAGSMPPLLAAIAVSRVGLWWYDLSLRQMIQGAAPEHLLAPLFAAEGSAEQCAQLVMLLLISLVFPRPSQFVIPVVISAIALVVAGVVLNVGARFKSEETTLELSTLTTKQGVDSATLLRS